MTISDAIKHLSYKIAYYKGSVSRHADDVLVEALELAVIALEELKDNDLKKCKDCPFSEEIDFGLYICHNENLVIVGDYVDGDWFCADGQPDQWRKNNVYNGSDRR